MNMVAQLSAEQTLCMQMMTADTVHESFSRPIVIYIVTRNCPYSSMGNNSYYIMPNVDKCVKVDVCDKTNIYMYPNNHVSLRGLRFVVLWSVLDCFYHIFSG